MRVFKWIVSAILFLLLLAFALKNEQSVEVNFFSGIQWHTPLIFVIFCTFAVGALFGAASAGMALFWRKREIARLKKQIARQEALPNGN
ncbi:MAG: LapA family protein [Ottowia sp.]|nr:LapA family protein [Ottowia sp.]